MRKIGCSTSERSRIHDKSIFLFHNVKLLLIAMFLFPVVVFAGSYEADILKAAGTGDPDSQYAAALLFEYGTETIAKDQKQALKWMIKAATGNVGGACFYLGLKYEYGNGVNKNLSKAACWYRCAARKDWPAAQIFLADMYEKGRGVPVSMDMATVLVGLAAEYDYPGAENNLGRLLPRSVFKDMIELKSAQQRLLSEEDVSCN